MKKAIGAALGAVGFVFPAFALASASIPLGQNPVQLLTTVAAIEAQEAAITSGQSLACAALTSATSTRVNAPIALAWGSVGAAAPAQVPGVSMWSPNGGSLISIQKPGTWTYSFTFYGLGGATTTCTAKIIVTAN